MKNFYSKPGKAGKYYKIFRQSFPVILSLLLIQFLIAPVQAQNFRASSSAGNSTTSLTISKPAGTINGDVMIAAVTVRPYSATITPPSGWTLIRKTSQSSGTTTSSQATYWKAAGASEPTTYSWTFSTSSGVAGGIATFYNINTTNPVNVESGQATASSLSQTAPGVTTTATNTMVVTTHSIASSTTWTPPTGMTECVDKYSYTSLNSLGTSIEMNYAAQAAAGATGTNTATAASFADYGVTQTMALVRQTAAISYSGSPYCTSSGTASVTQSGTTGGTYSSAAGLSINSSTGLIDLSASTAGTYTVTYSYATGLSTTTSVTVSAPPSPYAIRFDGANDYITTTNNLAATFTLEAWIKTTANSGTGTWAWQGNAIFWGDVAGLSNDFILSILNNKLAFDDGSVNTTTTGSKVLNDGIWHHVAVVRTPGSSGTVKLYVDGVQDGATGTAGSSVLNANSVISIGGYSGGAYFNGYIDEVRMWNTARTAAQLATYKSGNLVGNESGLINYYRFDEGVGGVAGNSASGTDGALVNLSTAAATGPISASGWVNAGISYSATAYCSNAGTATVSLASNLAAGTFSASPAGLSLNTTTGDVTLSTSAAGTYTVTNTTAGYNGCTMQTSTTITVAASSATISYAGNPYCSSAGTATVTRTGAAGGTFSSTTGLSLNTTTGDINLSASTAGTYTVTYYVAAGTCPAITATTSITITTQPNATGGYPSSPYCANTGIIYPSGSAVGAVGTFSSTTGLSIDQYYGTINSNASTAGTYTITYTVPASGGCATYTRTTPITITAAPSATISYTGSPYCATGTATVTRTGTAGGTYTSTTGLSINAASGDVNLATSTPGTYTVTYTVAAASPCGQFSTTATITINSAVQWAGTVNTLWSLASNWQCGIVPTKTTNVIIPSGLFNYPTIGSGVTAMANDITLQSGTSITISNGTLQIAGAVTTTGGKITTTSGKVEFNGSAAQTIPANLFSSNTVKDLVITNAAGVTLAGAVRVTSTVDFGNVNNSVLASNGFLTLVSTSTNSADLTDVTNGGVNTGNTVSGNVTVERYIQGRRAYRFLTAPVNSTNSIKANWMENVNNTTIGVNINPVPNYGTQITGSGGSANGFDVTNTNNSSLYTFNIATQTWTPAANTAGIMKAGNGYRILVRGSRAVNLTDNYATPSVTTLRATGTLVTGPVKFAATGGTAGMPALSAVSGAYSLVANPYASSVDWVTMYAATKDISPTFYIFDPTITGSNGRGGYVSYNGVLKVKNIISSMVNKDIQSGQSFFVQTTGTSPSPSITFDETYKSTTFLPVFRTANEVPHMNIELLLPNQTDSTTSADGTAVYFSDDFSNAIGNDDSYKFTNQDENIAILRDGKTLSLEGRKSVSGTDTVSLKMWQLTQKKYTFKITLDKFDNNVQAYLQDKFLKTMLPLSNGETLVPFEITSDAASVATDRFMVVFEALATLPVKLVNIKAYEKNKGVQVEWTAESESNMDKYEVERSADAQHFETVGSVKALNNSGVATTYSFFDAKPNTGDNYYRIKSIEKSGKSISSEVVKVRIATATETVSVYPNPVIGNVINVAFTNKQKGSYGISLLNSAAQKVYVGSINHNGGSGNYPIQVNNTLPKGIYQLLVASGDVTEKVTVFVQ